MQSATDQKRDSPIGCTIDSREPVEATARYGQFLFGDSPRSEPVIAAIIQCELADFVVTVLATLKDILTMKSEI